MPLWKLIQNNKYRTTLRGRITHISTVLYSIFTCIIQLLQFYYSSITWAANGIVNIFVQQTLRLG